MKQILLTQGKVAWVDDCDYEYLNQWKWHTLYNGNTFYAARKSSRKQGKRKTIYLHQVLSKRLGFDIDLTVDHINQDGLDNRRCKIREATPKHQVENRGLQKNNTSGHKGVRWHKRDSKWEAYIGNNGKLINLGYFDTLEDALAIRKQAEEKYFTSVT